MAILPDSKQGKMDWFSAHVTKWNTNKTAIGLTAAQITDLQAKLAAAQAALTAADQAREASKSATITLNARVNELVSFGAGLVDTIKAKAKTDKNVDIYALADIPAPAPPQPAGVPPVPSDLTFSIDMGGNVQIAWKGTLSNSAVFSVHRRLNGEPGFTIQTVLGAKKWIDATIPEGTTSATYYIVAHRGELSSQPSAQVNVVFGAAPQTNTITLKAA